MLLWRSFAAEMVDEALGGRAPASGPLVGFLEHETSERRDRELLANDPDQLRVIMETHWVTLKTRRKPQMLKNPEKRVAMIEVIRLRRIRYSS